MPRPPKIDPIKPLPEVPEQEEGDMIPDYIEKIKSPLRRQFVMEYCRHFNATRAAKEAGYNPNSAYSSGHFLLKIPEIKAAIEQRCADLSLGKDETLKGISDIAKASINDYFTIKERVIYPQVKISLSEYIQRQREQIEDLEIYASLVNLEEKELERHQVQVESLKRDIIKLQIELQRNPLAFRIIDGEPVLEKYAEPDLPKLIADKEAGRIKSLKITEYGPSIELYAADSALVQLARIHGLFEKDNEQGRTIIPTKVVTPWLLKKDKKNEG